MVSWGVQGTSIGKYRVVAGNVSTKYTGLPLMQLGDGDGERGEAEEGEEEDGEGTRSPNLSIKRSYLIAIKICKCMWSVQNNTKQWKVLRP